MMQQTPLKTNYYEGVDFHPTEINPTVLNLWRGPIDPKKGSCDIIDELLWFGRFSTNVSASTSSSPLP